jgi:methyltransferase (TIGR00027 family)
MPKPIITHVSDTAHLVASYRAIESERPDALFHDPLARQLAGERGRQIGKHLSHSRYTLWSVAIRTCVIDRYIHELLAAGMDTVLNLGAGLDARPYRMDLPASLRWIEVDHPHMIELKEEGLAGETPRCRLERIKLDLADRDARQHLFSQIAAESRQVLVLTEGVIPYLTQDQVVALAADLHREKSFWYWIVDYFSPRVLKYMRSGRRRQEMGNAPFLFFPDDWLGFFPQHRWNIREIRYLGEESLKLGRAIPMPWWAKVLRALFRSRKGPDLKKFTGYILLEPEHA